MFRVGQKVCCVSVGKGDIGPEEIGKYSKPVLGGVYTIATIKDWGWRTIITLHECDNSHLMPALGVQYEPGFNARHFRPLVERKTDISCFTRMLTPNKRRVEA